MAGLVGVSPAPQPLDLGASVGSHHAAGGIYLVAAVALPLALVVLVGLRVLSAPTRWAGWDRGGSVRWAWRAPYEAFALVVPVAGTVAAEWVAVAALSSGNGGTTGADRLILVTLALALAMGASALRLIMRAGPAAGYQGKTVVAYGQVYGK